MLLVCQLQEFVRAIVFAQSVVGHGDVAGRHVPRRGAFRGTGYYKVPSLRGVWYRSMFGHSGWCATLEDWFDPSRVRDDYVPTGFKPYGMKAYAVKGHPFGLKLSEDDRKALIAFLKTL